MEVMEAVGVAAFTGAVVFGVLGIIYALLAGSSFLIRRLERLHKQSSPPGQLKP